MNSRRLARLHKHQRKRRWYKAATAILQGARADTHAYYILHGSEPVMVSMETGEDLIAWAQWFEEPTNRIIAFDRVADVDISTIFLGISFRVPPILFETMVFSPADDGNSDNYQARYATLDAARAGHASAVRAVMELLEQTDTTAASIIERLRRRPA